MPTRTYSEMKEESAAICAALESKALMQVNPFIRPLDQENYQMTLDREKFRLWTGNAEVEITATNKTHRQAVLHVLEDARRVTRSFTVPLVRIYDKRNIRQLAWGAPGAVDVWNRFPVTVPGGKRAGYDLLEPIPKYRSNDSIIKSVQVRATMQVDNATNASFLVGFDETSQFVAELPEHASSVKKAHELLRPIEAFKKDTLRQGEFFFVPATKEELEQIKHSLSRGAIPHTTILERGSSHWATILRVTNDGKPVGNFAIGLVTDTRRAHHKPLVLTGWHRVVRNKEVVRPITTLFRPQQRRRWD